MTEHEHYPSVIGHHPSVIFPPPPTEVTMNPFHEYVRYETRRQFLGRGSNAVGWAALASLLGRRVAAASAARIRRRSAAGGAARADPLRPQGEAGDLPAHGRRAVADGPLRLQAEDGRVLRQGPARLGPDGPAAHDHDLGQKRFPIAPSKYKFAQHGESGMWVSELLPYTARMVDDMCFIRSMHTEAINHEPAITYMQTGNRSPAGPASGRGSRTAWAR